MRIKKQLALFSIALLTATHIIASPAITKVAGEFTEGQRITISGINFGAANATPLVWDTVDNQITVGQEIEGKKVPYSATNTWGENTHDDAWGSDILFTKKIHKPGRSASYSGGKRSDLGWPNAVKDKGLKNIFVSWWFLPNKDPAGNGGANKFIRIWDESDGEHTRISWTSTLLGHGANSVRGNPSWGDWSGKNGEWNKLEIWVSTETQTIKAWVNNKLIHDINDFKKSKTTQGLNIYLIGFDPSISANYPDFKFNLSDIYISPSIARVEISDKATWNDLDATREIQPIDSWKANSIELTLNIGSFNSLADKFLYVIDNNGDVNQNGYPLCAKCPQSPSLGIE